ncbi:DctP family TRAP transporter solute-binding subunit [Brevibacillus invocatus]|uniref:TRAP transporter substrate-binding protein n=1 Tax=Brevibacillus invocatus TaxID=173959 RepID=UPI00203CC536|nr:DctP family TRAP transporter solute-binding subunit [Brevibacillus invocatus]MCM3082018.1 DctP family TRAP transporter solute-binding subunit [Brevibacillus invocatus]MCM3432410.1 DctP family TRAP transporter solute-binding subunit [Brevibacillus invocatus]
MKKGKKLLGGLTVAMMLLLTACGGGGTQGGAATGDASNGAAGGAASDQKYNLRIAYLVPEEQSTHIAAVKFKETVEAKSEGRISVELYSNGSLFPSDREAIEAVQLGNVEMTIPAVAPLAGFNKKFMVFDLPFLFKTQEAAYKALDGEVGQELMKDLESNGFKGLVFGENGFRHMSNNKGPVNTPEDLKGLKLRTLENPVHTAIFNSFGANASPFAFGELYTALQQKVYDAMECPISLYYTNKFYEVQDYLTMSGHVYAATILLTNLDWYNSLPDDLKKVVDDAAVEYRDFQRKLATEQDAEFLAKLKENGMQVNELTPEQKDAFIAASKSVYDQFSKEIGEDLVKKAMDANN